MQEYSNTHIKLIQNLKLNFLISNFIFVPINSVTLPLKSTYTSHGFLSFFKILFNFIFIHLLKSQFNPMFVFVFYLSIIYDNLSILYYSI